MQERTPFKLVGYTRFQVQGRGQNHVYDKRGALAKTARDAAELYLKKIPSPYIQRITVVSEDGAITVFSIEDLI